MKKKKVFWIGFAILSLVSYAIFILIAFSQKQTESAPVVSTYEQVRTMSHDAPSIPFRSTSAWSLHHNQTNNENKPNLQTYKFTNLQIPTPPTSPMHTTSSAVTHTFGSGGGISNVQSGHHQPANQDPVFSTSIMLLSTGSRIAMHDLTAANTLVAQQQIIEENSPEQRYVLARRGNWDDYDIDPDFFPDPIGPLPVIFIFMLLTLYAAPIKARTDTTGVRVMSYNIRVANSGDGDNEWTHRRKATVSMLRDIEPEVFGVQEALPTQINYILGNCTRYRAVGVGREDGKREGEHMSVFYNWYHYRLMDWGTFWLSETPDTPSVGWDAACKRTATWTLLQRRSDGQRLYFVNTHLDHVGELSKQYGLMLIMDSIAVRNTEGYPVILTGDFNMWPNNTTLRVFRRRMEPARFMAEQGDEQGSFNGFGERGDEENPLMPIDYIYYANMSRCLTFRVVTDTYRRVPYISDHYPIYSDLLFH